MNNSNDDLESLIRSDSPDGHRCELIPVTITPDMAKGYLSFGVEQEREIDHYQRHKMNKPELSHARLEAFLDAKIERYFDTLDTDPDVLKQLLADKRSENTRRAYERDVNDFLKTMTSTPAVPDNVLEFLHLEERHAVSVVLKYKAKLIDKGLKEATVNRRLAAVKSLVEMGRKLGACHYSLEDIKGEKIVGYRDTTGVDRPAFERILQQCDLATLAGKRDYALLRLLWGNALRRNEISQLNVQDFDPASKTLRILGKGRDTSVGSSGLGRGDCCGDRRLVGGKGKFLAR